MASEGRGADSWSSESYTTALSPLSDSALSGLRGLRSDGSRSANGTSRRAGGRAGSASEGRVEVTPLDVGEGDGSRGRLRLDVGGQSRVCAAGTTSDTWLGSISISGVVAVEPLHAGSVVVPDRHGQNHAGLESSTHLLETAESGEVVGVAEHSLLLSTEVVGDGVDGVNSWDGNGGVLDDLAILNVETTDLVEVTVGSTVSRDELSDDGELAACVDGHTFAKESLVAHTEGVEIASVLITNSSVPLVVVTAVSARAFGLTVDGARVRSEGSGIVVGLPNVHLGTASSKCAASGVGVTGRTSPTLDVGLREDEV